MAEVNFNVGFKIPFRNFVLEDLMIGSLIYNRFYGAFLATFFTANTTFPLATFNTVMGNLPNLNIIQRFPLVIDSFSNKTYDEAYEIDAALMNLLGGLAGPITINSNIIIRPTNTAIEMYDTEARVYDVQRRYLVVYLP